VTTLFERSHARYGQPMQLKYIPIAQLVYAWWSHEC